jgi:hypothetical protein
VDFWSLLDIKNLDDLRNRTLDHGVDGDVLLPDSFHGVHYFSRYAGSGGIDMPDLHWCIFSRKARALISKTEPFFLLLTHC